MHTYARGRVIICIRGLGLRLRFGWNFIFWGGSRVGLGDAFGRRLRLLLLQALARSMWMGLGLLG